jgi:hypothetical protein
MNLLQTIMPIPIPIPHPAYGSGGPVFWTEVETKITLSILIVTTIVLLLAIVVEKIRGTSWKDIFYEDSLKRTTFTSCVILISFCIYGIAIVGFLFYCVYSLL